MSSTKLDILLICLDGWLLHCPVNDTDKEKALNIIKELLTDLKRIDEKTYNIYRANGISDT